MTTSYTKLQVDGLSSIAGRLAYRSQAPSFSPKSLGRLSSFLGQAVMVIIGLFGAAQLLLKRDILGFAKDTGQLNVGELPLSSKNL